MGRCLGKYNFVIHSFTIDFTTPSFICYKQRPFDVLHSNVSATSFSEKIFINASIDDQMRLNIVFKSAIDIYPFMQAAVMVDSGNGLYDMEYFNRTIDICRLLADSKYEPFLQLVARTTLPKSNFPKKCPIGKVFY